MPTSIRTKLTAAAAIAAAALGGSVVANAATSTTTTPSSAGRQAPPPQRDPSMGGHQANGTTETLLTGDTATKVEAAAKAKYPGATIERVENDADTGSAYEAHMTKADGSQVIVYVNSSFDVTGTGTMGHP
jgi:Spy/CpxP family protein refolding chaperone